MDHQLGEAIFAPNIAQRRIILMQTIVCFLHLACVCEINFILISNI